MTKCTLCEERLRDGLSPACVDACPTGALGFGRLDEAPGVDSLPGFPEADIRPRIRFRPLAAGREEPERRDWPSTATAATWPAVPQRQNRRVVNLASEWPLLVFTLVFACLVAFHASLLTDGRPTLGLPFLGVCLAAMGISTLHLGRRARAWRAVLNLRGSWLSREIAAFGAFVGLAGGWHLSALWEIDGPVVRFLPWAALYAGLIGLYSVDRVYDLALRQGPPLPHSASVLWTGTLAVALLLGSPWAAGVLLGMKLLVYLHRRLVRDRGAVSTLDRARPSSRFGDRWSLGAEIGLDDEANVFGRLQGGLPVSDDTDLYVGYMRSSRLGTGLTSEGEEQKNRIVTGGRRRHASGVSLFAENTIEQRGGGQVTSRTVGGELAVGKGTALTLNASPERSRASDATRRGGLAAPSPLARIAVAIPARSVCPVAP